MAGITSNVVTALMAKLELLFGRSTASVGLAPKNRFLSFQMPGIPVSPKDLGFRLPTTESGLTPQQALNTAADFARLVNFIPAVDSIWSTDGRILWNEYETILTQARVAASVRTASETAELQQARDFLFRKQQITDPLGNSREELVDSFELAAYKQYQTAYLSVLEQYNMFKLTAQNSTDPAVQADWQAKEPVYKAAVSSAYTDWIAKGYKAEVEEAFADIDRISKRNPQLIWAEWNEELDQSKRSDLTGQNFYDTNFYPDNFYQPNSRSAWTKLTLDASEIAALSAKASTSTRNLANSAIAPETQAIDLEVIRLSVELIQIPIIRSWFNPSVFQSGFWQWADGRQALSDGQDPPKGSLPAYTTSVIFARNLEVELKPNSEKNAQVISKLQSGKLMLLGPLPLRRIPPQVDPRSVTKLNASTLSMRQANPELLKQVVVDKSRLQLSSASLDLLSQKAAINPQLATDRIAPFGTGTQFSITNAALAQNINAAQLKQLNPNVVSRIDQTGVAKINPKLLEQLGDITVKPIRPIKPVKPIRPVPVPEEEPTPPPDPNEMQVIAFVCEKVPKSPNPDPSFRWE